MTPDTLLARIAAVEAVARAEQARLEEWYRTYRGAGIVVTEWDTTWDPARVLAVCAGAKTLLELHYPYYGGSAGNDPTPHGPYCHECGLHAQSAAWPCRTLSAVAAMFAEPGEES